MSHFPIDALVGRLERAGARVALVARGIDHRRVGEVFRALGASRVLLDSFLPESDEDVARWLGTIAEDVCSQRAARAIAMAAYQRAHQRITSETAVARREPLAGVACLAGSDDQAAHGGPSTLHVAWQTASTTAALSLELAPDRHAPGQRDQIALALLLGAMAEACGVGRCIEPEMHDEETIVDRRSESSDRWGDLLRGQIDRVIADDSAPPDKPQKDPLIFPGAFDPLHAGHRQMAKIAGELLGRSVAFELSIENVDKPPLDFIDIADRGAQFTTGEPLWLTRAATFVEKANLFPGATFIVGSDTIARIADPRYYGDDTNALRQAIDAVRAAECRFLVFGRRRDAKFQTLGELNLPAPLEEICRGVSVEQFRDDVSSTALRRGRQR